MNGSCVKSNHCITIGRNHLNRFSYHSVTMTILVIIEKSGSLKEQKVKDLKRDTIYKKCNFRKSEGFELRNSWLVKDKAVHIVELWSRDAGKSGTENKYDLPPPIDTPLYFGNMAAVGVNNKGELIDLTVSTWKRIYEQLFGGFEDLGAESEDESDDELDNVPREKKTKNGYLKDGFVIDPEDEDSDNNSFEESEEETAFEDDEEDEEDEIDFDEGSELAEEDYYYSDDNDDGTKKKKN